jgi:hypothetical protein
MDTSLPPGALPEPKARLSSVVTAIGLLKAFYESDIEIGTSALGPVWTAPGWQELFSRFAALVGAAMCPAF